MPSPFPGMDPWLEQPGLWENLHTSLITSLRDVLGPLLRPRYYVAIEESVYADFLGCPALTGKPDVSIVSEAPAQTYVVSPPAGRVASPVIVELPYDEVRVRHLEIRRPHSGEVITTVEILSPVNQRPGDRREQYELKRWKITHSSAHLVEIDLLRGWEPMEFLWPGNGGSSQYRILVSRSDQRPRAKLYPFSVRDPFPRFHLPLRPDDVEPVIDLKPLLDGIYDRGGFDLVIKYSSPPIPPLSGEDAAWANELTKRTNPP
ncbi:MAG: DUF4058 family protein [Chloroflexi bacterium]|nr:DUF4058 family protein [Chloroflexota bacterium]